MGKGKRFTYELVAEEVGPFAARMKTVGMKNVKAVGNKVTFTDSGQRRINGKTVNIFSRSRRKE